MSEPEREINPAPEADEDNEVQQESKEDYFLDREGDCDYKGDKHE